ncbi:MAG: BamA/TamA family outer membrane protein [Candidatus Stygibacter frigidus]|nr:BamA/TamA family outer membrane protein [Candidatus Stygibacter frigidus]
MKKILIFVIIIIYCSLQAEFNGSLHAYPIIDYSDETSLTGGGVLIYLYRPEGQDKSVPPSLLKLQIDAGIKSSWTFEIENESQLEEGKYAVNIPLKFEKQKCELYKTGNDIELGNTQKNELSKFDGSFEMLRRWEKYHFGFTYKINYTKYKSDPDVSLLQYDDQILPSGGWCVGPGLTFQYNTLDNYYFPLNGIRMQFNLQTYSEALSSSYTFDRYSFNSTFYLKLARFTTAALGIKLISNIGDVPYQELASLGNELRIFRSGQYADYNLVSMTGEIRSFPFSSIFWHRFGIVIFAEAGQSRNNFEDFYFTGTRYGIGIGFRYLLDMEENFTLRLDSGLYKSQISTDFGANEAF